MLGRLAILDVRAVKVQDRSNAQRMRWLPIVLLTLLTRACVRLALGTAALHLDGDEAPKEEDEVRLRVWIARLNASGPPAFPAP